MKALTVWQPWASLLMMPNVKRYETRGWMPYRAMIGQRVAIHAAAITPVMDPHIETRTRIEALLDCPAHQWPKALPRSVILGTARFVGAYRVATFDGVAHVTFDQAAHGSPEARGALFSTATGEHLLGNYAPGRWLWKFDQHEVFPEPIQAKGAQGFWNWEPPSEAA